MAVLMPEPQNTMLGRETKYGDRYDPSLLQAIPRALGRDAIGAHDFRGVDVWRLYEFTWLAPSGLPRTAVLEMRVPATSPSIVESKSLKLYQGSFAQEVFPTAEAARSRFAADLSQCLEADVEVRLYDLLSAPGASPLTEGELLDDLPFEAGAIAHYETEPQLLRAAEGSGRKRLWRTTLFRSLCPVTGQPDYATVLVRFAGRIEPDPASLLAYLVSYRTHRGFHEQCCEQIYHDLETRFSPELLEVSAFFTRRGGIDINPFRSSVRDSAFADGPAPRGVRQ